jgi:hypothetical protein
MDYPDLCIRGVINHHFLDDDGNPKTDVFIFQKNHSRPDGWTEESINWQDDEKAINFTLKQKRSDGEI